MADAVTRARDQIQAVHVHHLKKMEKALFHHMRKVAIDWQMLYPKRKVEFIDAMGSCIWSVDGNIIWWDNYHRTATWDERVTSSKLLYEVVLPLIEACDWYMDMAQQCCNIGIDDITLTPIKK